MVQNIEHEEQVDELVTLENFSPEERLSQARQRRQEQLKAYKIRDSKPELYPNYHASHNKKIIFDNNIELIESASRNDYEEVEQMLRKGFSPNLQNEDGISALHQAVIEDCSDVVETLVTAGADLNIKDADLWTPLHAAVACGNLDLIKYLVDKGASLVEINTDGNMPIDLVDDMEDIEMFLDGAMSDAGYDEEQLEGIRNATANVMLSELREHVHNGGSLNDQGEHGETMMHIAAANGYNEVVEYLLDHGAKIDVLDNDYWQPIHAAACWGHDKIIEILVNHGADLDAITKDGETPYDLTEDEELQDMIVELKESGTKTRELKRSQSNSSRTLSVRRTSIVEKHKISVNDAKQEKIFRQNPDFLHVVINTGEEHEEEERQNTNGDNAPSSDEKDKIKTIVTLTPSTTSKKPDAVTVEITNVDSTVKFSKEEKITIDNDDSSATPTATENTKPLNSSQGQTMVEVEGQYKTKSEDATHDQNDTEKQTNVDGNSTTVVQGKQPLNPNDVDVELGETHGSHNTAAVKNKNKQFTESTDISVKKKCCIIL